MPMRPAPHVGREDSFHIPSRVLRCGADWKRANHRDALAIGRAPTRVGDGEEPDFAERFDDGSLRSLGRPRCGVSRKMVQMPEERPGRQCIQDLAGREVAADLLARWLIGVLQPPGACADTGSIVASAIRITDQAVVTSLPPARCRLASRLFFTRAH
jgi:hypothetical protein